MLLYMRARKQRNQEYGGKDGVLVSSKSRPSCKIDDKEIATVGVAD